MRTETESAVNFVSKILKGRIDDNRVDVFRDSLLLIMRTHYQDHWFPEKPCKGSAYRCIRINHQMDPLIRKAGTLCGLSEEVLFAIFPNELTLWIDPEEVSYRIGEDGSIGVLHSKDYNESLESLDSLDSLESLDCDDLTQQLMCKDQLQYPDSVDNLHQVSNIKYMTTYVAS